MRLDATFKEAGRAMSKAVPVKYVDSGTSRA